MHAVWLCMGSLPVRQMGSGSFTAACRPALQVRASIKAAQEAECERVKADMERFSAAVAQYVGSIYSKRAFFAWATGVEAAFSDIEKVNEGGQLDRERRAAGRVFAACTRSCLPTIMQVFHIFYHFTAPIERLADLQGPGGHARGAQPAAHAGQAV